MTTETLDTRVLMTNLVKRHGATDLQSLYGNPAFQAAYSRQAAAAPGVSKASLMAKAINDLRFESQTGQTIKAWLAVPDHINYEFDNEMKPPRSVPKEVGVVLVTADGESKFVKFGEFDGTKPLDGQAPQGGWIPSAQCTSPVLLGNVNVTLDHGTGHRQVKLVYKDGKCLSTISTGGHNDPFPTAPTLETEIGKTAQLKGWGAYKKDKKTGVLHGRFGDGDGEEVCVTLTFPTETKEIKSFTSNEEQGKHVIRADLIDGAGYKVSPGIPFHEAMRRIGRSPDTPQEAVAAILAGRRIFCRGQGSIFIGKKPSDFGFTEESWAHFVTDFTTKGFLATFGGKSQLRRLWLSKMSAVDARTGEQLPSPTFFTIGDKKIYDIQEKADGTWEISLLCYDEHKVPGFHVKPSAKDPKEGRMRWNVGSFFVFLDGLEASELPDDDPILQMVRQSMLALTA